MKLGRLPRARMPGVPHMSAILAGTKVPTAPPSTDYLSAMPDSLGVMLNDAKGCCTISGMGHGEQVWTFNAQGSMFTVADSSILKAYEEFCGYSPANPNSDQGGVEQVVLLDWIKRGLEQSNHTAPRNHLRAFIEVDPRNHNDVMNGIADCGFIYSGFSVPAYLESAGYPAVWDLDPAGDQTIIGGHCVVHPSYDAKGTGLISWGSKYVMTWAFWDAMVEECYVLADAKWIEATGKTPGGLTPNELRQQMGALLG